MTITSQVLRMLAKANGLSRKEMAVLIGCNEYQVKKALENLMAQGKLTSVVTPTKYCLTAEGARAAATPPTAKALEMRRFRARKTGVEYVPEAGEIENGREVSSRLADGIIESAMRTRPSIETAWMGVA